MNNSNLILMDRFFIIPKYGIMFENYTNEKTVLRKIIGFIVTLEFQVTILRFN